MKLDIFDKLMLTIACLVVMLSFVKDLTQPRDTFSCIISVCALIGYAIPMVKVWKLK